MRQPTGAQTVRRQQDEGPITIEQAGLNLAKSIVASPKFKVSFVLWAIGMFLCAFAAPPFQLTEGEAMHGAGGFVWFINKRCILHFVCECYKNLRCSAAASTDLKHRIFFNISH